MDFEEFTHLEDKEFVYFNGTKYCRMGGKRRYFLSYATKNAKRKNPKGLHIAIWEYVHKQEVKKGYIVHHKDGNPFNNHPDNLECLSLREHLDLHKEARERWGRSEQGLKHLEEIRELTKEWHASEEGRAWHRKHAKESMAKRREKRVCADCGKEFDYCGKGRKTKAYDGRWCKKCYNKIWARLYRKLKSGKITRLQFECEWRSLFC